MASLIKTLKELPDAMETKEWAKQHIHGGVKMERVKNCPGIVKLTCKCGAVHFCKEFELK